MSKSIYDIEEKYYDLLKQLDEEDCDIEEITNQLLSLDGERIDKIRNIANFIRDRLALAETHKQAADKIKDRARVYNNRADGLKAFLLSLMQSYGMKKAEGDDVTITIRNGTAYEYDENLIPDQYFKEIPATRQLDKSAAKKEFKEGKLTVGITVKDNPSLLIR